LKIRGLAHITGGGLLENIPRVLPEGMAVTLDPAAWPLPPVIQWLALAGGLQAAELARTLNCGIGMAVICAPDQAAELTAHFEQSGETVYRIGSVIAGADKQVLIPHAAKIWALAA